MENMLFAFRGAPTTAQSASLQFLFTETGRGYAHRATKKKLANLIPFQQTQICNSAATMKIHQFDAYLTLYR